MEWRTQWCTWAFRETVTGHLTHTTLFCATAVCSKACTNLCEPMDCSLPVSSVRGIFQAIILEWVSISFSRGSIFPTQGLNPPLLVLLHWQADSSPPGKPYLQLPQIHNVPWNCSALKTKQNKNKNKNSVFLCPRCYGQTSAPALRVRMCPAAGLMQLDWLISHNHIKSIYLLSILWVEDVLWRYLILWHSLIIQSCYCFVFILLPYVIDALVSFSAKWGKWCLGYIFHRWSV